MRAFTLGAVALTAANCSSQKTSSGSAVDPKYGVAASPRVVEDGEAVPKGGGRAMVGRPYVVGGQTYVPRDNPNYVREGLASWYGLAFHGRRTANGEVFDRYSVGAAHPTMPLPSYARVTNLHNNRTMIVRVNDRGPYHANRIMDVSERVAEALDFKRAGTARVRIEYVGRASLRGSGDAKLMATLRQDGRPVPGLTAPIMVAQAATPGSRSKALAFRDAGPGGSKDPNFDPLAHVPAPAAPTPAPAPVTVAKAPDTAAGSAIGRLFSSLTPVPPERPLDLMTIPNAASPVRKAGTPVAQLPPPRPATAGLFFSAPDLPRSSFTKDNPFKDMKPQRFVAFKGQP
ncbi:MAG TPA: septal ring lytic transglycosylase RlpA family protein [Beijerinckiaceae bacterium]|nr:septal ring lytic transglycosylase RlpA family protein [Beijerinckiaceae bacterium]